MHQLLRVSPVLALIVLAGCSTGGTDVNLGPTLNQPNAALAQPALTPPTSTPPVLVATASTAAMTDVAAYIDPTALGKLSAKDKAEASSAQFNALTFGRPGAPRAWAGDSGATGNVLVGPYVRVNNIDCRDFTHTVTIAGLPYAKKGTACREADGSWTVS
jgi:surface antigen